MSAAHVTLFSGGRLLDPRRAELLEGVDILVENGLIKEVSDRPINASGANRLELKGRTIMPGLIDAHVHMYYNEDTIGQLQFVPTTYAAAKAAFVLKGMLMRGFTTVRDMAGGDFGMRAASEANYVDVPRLFISGRAITQTGGHGDFRDRSARSEDFGCCTPMELFSVIADGVPDVIKAVRNELRLGVDHIKLMLSGGVASPNDPLDSLQYRVDEIEAATDEAHRWGVYVGGHAYSDDAIRRGVMAGVRTIEHGNFLGAETAAIMRERGAFLVPTLITYDVMKRFGEALGKTKTALAKNEIVIKAGLESLEIAKNAGVEIGFGTDVSMKAHPYQCEGLALQARALSNADVIRSATLVNAKILKLEGRLGEIVAGAHADILVVDGNPYDDLTIFKDGGPNLRVIMKGGKLYKTDL